MAKRPCISIKAPVACILGGRKAHPRQHSFGCRQRIGGPFLRRTAKFARLPRFSKPIGLRFIKQRDSRSCQGSANGRRYFSFFLRSLASSNRIARQMDFVLGFNYGRNRRGIILSLGDLSSLAVSIRSTQTDPFDPLVCDRFFLRNGSSKPTAHQDQQGRRSDRCDH